MAALKTQIAAVQAIKSKPVPTAEAITSRLDGVDTGLSDARNEVAGLRSSLHDLACAQRGEIAALTKRLEKIETKMAARADLTGSIPRKPASKMKAAKKPKPAEPPKEAANVVPPKAAPPPPAPETQPGHVVDVKQQAVPIVVLPARDPAAPGY